MMFGHAADAGTVRLDSNRRRAICLGLGLLFSVNELFDLSGGPMDSQRSAATTAPDGFGTLIAADGATGRPHGQRAVLTVLAVLAPLVGTLAANAAEPQGKLRVHGRAVVGQELRVDASGITDADGGVAAISYHWRRGIARRIRDRLYLRLCEGESDVCPDLGTGETYVPTPHDADKYLGVQASVTDGEGNRHYVIKVLSSPVEPGGVSASPHLLRVSEGQSASYQVALRSEPAQPVTFDIAGTVGTDVSVSPATLTFTALDWSMPKTVTVPCGQGRRRLLRRGRDADARSVRRCRHRAAR